MKKSLLFLLFATQALAGPPLTWGPDNKALFFQAGVELPQSATPTGNPVAGYNYVYPKADDKLYIKSSAGVESAVGGGGAATAPFTSSAANPAATGVVRYANTDSECWRNAANTADTCISLDATNTLSIGSSAQAISSVLLGKGSTASGTPVASTLGITPATGTNIAGANLGLAGGGSTGTGAPGNILFQVATAGSTGALANAPATVVQVTPKGLTVGQSTAQNTVALYVKQDANNFTGLLIKGTGTEWAFNTPGTNFGFGLNGQNSNINIVSADSSFSYQPGAGGAGLNVQYGFEAAWSATQGAPTTYANLVSHTAVTPMVVARTRNTTPSILLGFTAAGPSDRPSGGIYFPCSTVTSSAEVCSVSMGTMNAGTYEEHFRLLDKGLAEYAGTIPTVTCNAVSATVETGSNSNYARFTIPSTPGTSCIVTLPEAAASNPICEATDEGISALEAMVCSSTTSCTITDAGMVATNKISFHCGAHL